MGDMTEDESILYRVVRNHEEQHSIWLADRDIPKGWHDIGMSGPRQACLEHIDAVWPDIRPLSLRRRLAAMSPGGDARSGRRPDSA